jgi:hypothetical protein
MAAMRAKLESIGSEPGQKDGPVKKATDPQAPPKPPEKAPEDKAPEEVKPPDAKLDDKAPEKPTPDGKPKKPSDYLRDELAKQKARAEALEAEVTKFKTSQPAEDPEKKTLAEKLAAIEKKAKEYEDELRFTNYERSPEFKEKYVKPFNDAYAEAISDIEQMTVPVDLNDPEGAQRKATKDDLNQIVNLPPQQAGKAAKLLFGEGAQTMMNHRDSVLRTWKAQQNALAEGRKIAEQREKEITENQTKQQAEVQKQNRELRISHEPEFLERHKDIVLQKDDKGEWMDAESAKLLDQDRSVTDMLFSDDTKLAPEKKLALHAEMRNRAVHFGTVLRGYRKAMAELAEANKKIAEYEKSEPQPGEGAPKVLPELQGAYNMKALMGKVAGIARDK